MKPSITRVYIDGFNFYYGILNRQKKKGYKWLDLDEWIKKVLKPAQFDIRGIKFFTAKVSGTRTDKQKPVRQQTYWRALRTLSTPKVEIIKGNFQKKRIKVHINEDAYMIARKYEEKGTDVNLAAHFVNDAHNKQFETGVIVSNDSDLTDAVRIVAKEIKLKVIVINPCKGQQASAQLRKHATATKAARDGQIITSQFPPSLIDAAGKTITKPATW